MRFLNLHFVECAKKGFMGFCSCTVHIFCYHLMHDGMASCQSAVPICDLVTQGCIIIYFLTETTHKSTSCLSSLISGIRTSIQRYDSAWKYKTKDYLINFSPTQLAVM